MKRLIAVFAATLLLLTALFPLTASAAYPLPADVSITSRAAIVVYLGADSPEDMVMFEQAADERIAPGGMVRILVGLYALKTMEEQNIDPAIATGTYTEQVNNMITGTGLYTVGMTYGDLWRVEDLLNIAMIQTAADALGTLVVTLSGSQARFVEGMNALAAEIGCTNSHFSNVFGLDAADQYTSARDTYTILRYATLRYPQMIRMLSQTEYTATPLKGESDSWPTTNDMLRLHSEYYYEPLVLGRSGYSEAAGQACASIARNDGREFLTVTLGARDTDELPKPAFTDAQTLYHWAYNSFTYKNIVSKNQPVSRIDVALAWNTDSVALVAGDDLQGMLRNDLDVNTLRYEITLNEPSLTAPVEKGQACGEATVYDGDEIIGKVPLCAAQTINRSQILAIGNAVWTVVSSPAMLIVMAIFVLLLIGYIILSVVHNNNRRKNNQKRIKRYK